MWRSQRGFTLLEVLLSVGLLTALAGVSLPIYASFMTRNDLDLTTQATADMFRRAQTYSRNGHQDSRWGVAVQSQQVVLYKGASYATRDANYDEITPVNNTITVAGLSEVAFSKLEGRPSASGNVTLSALGNTKTITLNSQGAVDY